MTMVSHLLVLPGVALAFFMVFAMMECVAAFLARPSHRSHASTREALLARLLALNGDGLPYRVEPGGTADLEIVFDPVRPAWRAQFGRVKLTTSYRARLLLDPERRQVRWFEMVAARSCFIGFDSFRPRFSWGVWAFAGYIDVRWTGWAYGILPGFPPRIGDAQSFSLDTIALKRQIRGIVGHAGWEFRPKVWWFQVRRRRDGSIPRGFIPSSTRHWTEKQFWATTYPVSYLMTVLYIVVAAGGWAELTHRSTVLPVVGFTAFWWAVTGSIMAIFYVLGRPRRRRERLTTDS